MPDKTVRIGVQKSEVILSGILTLPKVAPIVFNPLPPPYENYEVEVIFNEDASGQINIRGENIGQNHRITLTNFGNASGVSTQTPMYVANYLGRKVFLHLACFTIGQTNEAVRMFSYTFFDGGAL